MIRLAALAGIGLLLSACARGPGAPPLPEAVVVVNDSAGSMLGGGIPSPDGTRLMFTRTVLGRSAVFVASADGSNPVRRTHGVWDQNPVWSPDGRWIAYHAEDPDFDLFVVPTDSGAPRQLTSGPGRDTPNGWMPDGSGVVFTRSNLGDQHTMMAPLDGGPPRRLGPVMAGDLHAAVSPDGTKLGFDLHTSGGATIWVQDLAGGGAPRQLTAENLENAPASSMWSPDGKQIAYTSRRTGTLDIWIMDVASGDARQLTKDVRGDFSSRWSPDGRWIAFLSDRGGQLDLWLVPSAGGNAVRLTNDRAVELNPRWAPDGRSIYFGRDETNVEVQLLPADGGPARTLLAWEGVGIQSADLAPDGGTVLFGSDRSGNMDIWSVPAAGGEPTPFVTSPLDDVTPQYSPDGSQVVFISNRAGPRDLWVIPAAGGEARNLTAGPGDEGEMVWSPDGKRIAYSSDRDVGGGDLWVITVEGGEAIRLTRENVRPITVEWSPDGRHLYFVGERPGGAGGRDLYRIPSAGGRAEPLAAGKSIGNSRLSPDGTRLAYSTFEGGWAFLNLISASGGPSRRITRETESIYHPFSRWFPDGARLLVFELDLPGSRDAFDLSTFGMADSSWQRLTRTQMVSEEVHDITADGKHLLVVSRTNRGQVRRVPVADLLREAAPERK